ncbi:variable surface protein [Plasmodium gonderi]|uniref:Variable surface protein n=1 Tax=Plasmodium gonderi TaxID=77519 RepID=A0A1Y1JSI0_PLAGO|nr:variable surface protein [Plasmodium gonderi]GAW84408.1 variable surface protein [Plasmodium gonderi]
MESRETSKNGFDFSNIFPICKIGFSWKPHSIGGNFGSHLTKLCSDFYNNQKMKNGVSSFSQQCHIVTLYLYYLSSIKSEINIQACCKFFFYKLWDLLGKYGWSCGDTKGCYEKMKIEQISTSNQEISSLFSLCSVYPIDLNEGIFQIFKRIDETYDNLSLLIRDNRNPQESKFQRFKSGMNYLESIHNMYNDTFKQLLIDFNNSYLTYLKGLLNSRYSSVKPFLSYRIKDKNITGVLNVLDKKTQMHALTGTDNDRDISTDMKTNNGTQISTGICFLVFNIIIPHYFQYTTFGSYIQPKARIVRKLMKRSNKERMSLSDSYERMYHDLNDKVYEKAYI